MILIKAHYLFFFSAPTTFLVSRRAQPEQAVDNTVNNCRQLWSPMNSCKLFYVIESCWLATTASANKASCIFCRRASLPFCHRKLRVGTRMLAVQPIDDESRFLRD